jgi:hypothetical protein
MKTRSVRALTYLTETTANAQEEAKLSTQTQPNGNRHGRRKQKAFNRLLNRKLSKMSELGPVNVSVGPDGVPHVTVSKNKLLTQSKKELEEIKKNPEALVSGPGREGLGPRPLPPDLPCGCRLWDKPPVIRKGCELHDRGGDVAGPPVQALRAIFEGNVAQMQEVERCLDAMREDK